MIRVSIVSMLFFILLPVVLIASSCSPRAVTEKDGSIRQPVPPPGAEVTSGGGWEGLLREAKKEGRLSIFSVANGQLKVALIKAMRDKFGIEVDLVSGRAADLTPRLANERKAGIYTVDVYIGGAPDNFINKYAGFLESLDSHLILPEVRDEKLWWEGHIPWHDKDKQVFAFIANYTPYLTINTGMVKEGEITSYSDLLHPNWKGKIVLNDPTTPGVSLFWFTVVASKMPGGLDFMRELARTSPMITRDQRLQVEWVAQGKYPLAIAAQPQTVDEFKKAGAAIHTFDPSREGSAITSSSGNLALLKSAPHPAAAKVFINWLLSREGQTLYSETLGFQSGRNDVSLSHLDPARVRKEGGKYFSVINEEFIKVRDEYAKYAQEIFGPLLR